jgi:hypothetical protein
MTDSKVAGTITMSQQSGLRPAVHTQFVAYSCSALWLRCYRRNAHYIALIHHTGTKWRLLASLWPAGVDIFFIISVLCGMPVHATRHRTAAAH